MISFDFAANIELPILINTPVSILIKGEQVLFSDFRRYEFPI